MTTHDAVPPATNFFCMCWNIYNCFYLRDIMPIKGRRKSSRSSRKLTEDSSFEDGRCTQTATKSWCKSQSNKISLNSRRKEKDHSNQSVSLKPIKQASYPEGSRTPPCWACHFRRCRIWRRLSASKDTVGGNVTLGNSQSCWAVRISISSFSNWAQRAGMDVRYTRLEGRIRLEWGLRSKLDWLQQIFRWDWHVHFGK